MRKINKIVNIALIYMVIGVLVCPSTTYGDMLEKLHLRKPLDFSDPIKSFRHLHAIVVEKIRKDIKECEDIHGRRSYISLPKVEFLDAPSSEGTKDRITYKYYRIENKILFYISEDIKERDIWLAYGEWFVKNERHFYKDRNARPDPRYINWLRDTRYIKESEVKGKKVLDVGTGAGVPGILIAKSGASQVISLDILSFELDMAKREAKGWQLDNITFQKGDIMKLAFRDNCFDIVFCNFVFYRFPQELRRIALEEMLRVLKPGSKVKLIVLYAPWSKGWNDTKWLQELEKVGFEQVALLNTKRPGTMPPSVFYTLEAYKPFGELEQILVNNKTESDL